MDTEFLSKSPKREDTARKLLKTGTNANLPHAGFSLCPSLGSYLESFRAYYMPDTVLVNTTNTTLEKVWALSSRRSLSRKKKNAYHKISAMGEEDAFLMVQKWREGWSWLLKDQ